MSIWVKKARPSLCGWASSSPSGPDRIRRGRREACLLCGPSCPPALDISTPGPTQTRHTPAGLGFELSDSRRWELLASTVVWASPHSKPPLLYLRTPCWFSREPWLVTGLHDSGEDENPWGTQEQIGFMSDTPFSAPPGMLPLIADHDFRGHWADAGPALPAGSPGHLPPHPFSGFCAAGEWMPCPLHTNVVLVTPGLPSFGLADACPLLFLL